MPSLRFIIPLENILFSTKMITSLRSVIITSINFSNKFQRDAVASLRHPFGGREGTKMAIAIFNAQNQMAAPF